VSLALLYLTAICCQSSEEPVEGALEVLDGRDGYGDSLGVGFW